ncbi:MAG: hypothetical protein CBD74_09075 [Saprospirales bacterium TMED214]|nr:MAG: hypothetical protein CBD74_09075 [Saprospirales bacterium TMED214]
MDDDMRVSRRFFTTVAVSAIASAGVGCASGPSNNLFSKNPSSGTGSFLDSIPFVGKKEKMPEPYPNPVKLAVTWTPDTIIQTGRTPTRGFGGRVFFYDDKSKSVPVEGTLVVHGFDDSAGDDKSSAKRFEFTPEQFTRHFSQSDLGASYSIWIPWDAIGGDQKRISLVTSFKSISGRPIQGIPATMMLPGTTPPETEEDSLARLSPQYQRYMQAANTGGTRKTGLTTTTIRRHANPSALQNKSGRPALNIPGFQQSEAQVATGGNTPSLSVDMLQKTSRSNVIPVSAQTPASRR